MSFICVILGRSECDLWEKQHLKVEGTTAARGAACLVCEQRHAGGNTQAWRLGSQTITCKATGDLTGRSRLVVTCVVLCFVLFRFSNAKTKTLYWFFFSFFKFKPASFRDGFVQSLGPGRECSEIAISSSRRRVRPQKGGDRGWESWPC